ncbi:uncharacterized protein LOC125017744 [Mugil cephalus]|uniref:uncharacterized protein LOC125017744 n=1 Tax=Mugil cephalus TaxID=48193 RepID=UPI001FB6191A|nr:uncharacterized protein LOC125017744 [Mugil cephalus]
MTPTPQVSQRFFELVKNAVTTFVVIVLFFILQRVFDMHFVCSCKEGLHPNGVLFLILPPLILALVVNITEPFHKIKVASSLSCFSCKGAKKCYCTYFFKWIVKYIGLSAVWIAVVLFDGDWYFCLRTNFNTSQIGLPCKKNLTYVEQRIKDKYMTDSLDYGLYVLCGFLCLWSIAEIRKAYFHFMPCRCPFFMDTKSCCVRCIRCEYHDPYYSVIYDELLAQQVSSHLNDELKLIATDKARKMCEPYLNKIKSHELSGNYENHCGDKTVSEVWEKISTSDFYLKEDETRNLT